MSDFFRKLGRSRGDSHSTSLPGHDDGDDALTANQPDDPFHAHFSPPAASPIQHTTQSSPDPGHLLFGPLPHHLRSPSPSAFSRSSASNYGSHSLLELEARSNTARVDGDDEFEPSPNSLGLHLIHAPENPNIDFIFVHGLGGSSIKTWTYQKSAQSFWPMWLPQETEFAGARIFTYGYNSNYKGRSSTSWRIVDFAKDLLLRLLTFTETAADGSNGRMGKNPIIFVAHSMGGLVVKKAYVLGRQNKQYNQIIGNVRAIMFLATPHRGANYAKLLNTVLEASPFGTSKKEYVAQLETASQVIQDINDDFRLSGAELILVSFYETEKMHFTRGVNKIIVDQHSAVLDYPHEQSGPLNATHQSICKFKNAQDDNYVSVKNMLKLVASRITEQHKQPIDKRPSNAETLQRLENIFGIREHPENYLKFVKDQLSDGSCQWIVHKPSFRNWADASHPGPDIFWLTGPPAAGKSTLASYVIDWIRDSYLGVGCQYHFFVSNHQGMKTTAYYLRSMAFQLCQSFEVIQQALFTLNDETNATFWEQSETVIWERVFEGIVFRIPLNCELYWVIDAVDEAEGAASLCNLLLKARSVNRIKVFITSRKTKDLANILNRHQTQIIHESLTNDDTAQDIRTYVTLAIRAHFPQNEDTQNDVVQEILEKANGSFLWVKLTLESMRDSWYTLQDIRKAMDELPGGMEPLYDRMLQGILRQSPQVRAMAQKLLTWAVCSFRPLRIAELEEALLPQFGALISLEDTINQICGHFIYISNSQVTLVHATARHFLLNRSRGFISKHMAHEHLALGCLRYLSDDKWRRVFALGPKGIAVTQKTQLQHYADDHPLLLYAVHHWAYHVRNATCSGDRGSADDDHMISDNDDLLEALEEFFDNYVLVWIHSVVLSGYLRTLARTAQHIRGFVHRKVRMHSLSDSPPLSLRTRDFQWLRPWAVDLIRIMGRFGKTLTQDPRTIYRMIPIFCPSESRIGMTYGARADSQMSLSGLSSRMWDDCLARCAGNEDETMSQVCATETNFVTLSRASGRAIVWSAETCQETKRVCHGEYVTMMTLNKRGTLLATAGMKTVRIWELSSGKKIIQFAGNSKARTEAIAFGDLDTTIVVGRDDYSVQTYDISSGEVLSTFWARRWDTHLSGPRFMMLSPDLSKVAVAARGKPVFIWDRDRPADQEPWRYVWSGGMARHKDDQNIVNPTEIARWHPDGTSLFILYLDTNIVHWHFLEDTHKVYSNTGGRDMVISKDGNFVLTGDSQGTLSVWALPRFQNIYKLFWDDLVRDIAFSPDGQRIYDSRGAFCNVWEPDVLIRHEESSIGDTSSNFESNPESSVLSDLVISHHDSSRSKITALADHHTDLYYCCGTDQGTVDIHEAGSGARIRKVYGHSTFAPITALEWSPSGKYMVSVDISTRVICKRLEPKEPGKWGVFPVFDFRITEATLQLLFDPTETMLLISTETSDVLWHIRSKGRREVCRKTWPQYVGRRWITHPQDPSKLLWIEPTAVRVFSWETLELVDGDLEPSTAQGSAPVDTTEQTRPRLSHTKSGRLFVVRNLSMSHDARYLLAEIVPHLGRHQVVPLGVKVHLLSWDAMKSSSSQATSFTYTPLEHLSSLTARILGFHQERVLFLDRQLWVCSWDLAESETRRMKKHFFLPRDWVNWESIGMVTCNTQGTVFCPWFGDVAIVRDGIRM